MGGMNMFDRALGNTKQEFRPKSGESVTEPHLYNVYVNWEGGSVHLIEVPFQWDSVG